MTELAILGGEPTFPRPLQPYRSIGPAERRAVEEVLDSGCLSGYYGSWCDEYWGGPKVRALERAWADRFECDHAVSVNSATSGLLAAVGAAGVGPGDEVIVPPMTMSATAIAPLFYGGIPIFADVEPEAFCLDPERVEERITPQTRVIVAVNYLGHPARLHELREIADENDLVLIEDNAQAILAEENGRYAGTVGHIGVFSLNFHKHIHTGEGGVCVTDDEDLAQRLKLIRNHGENVVGPLGIDDLTNLVGLNLRMTEMAAAVGIEQLRTLEAHVERRVRIAEGLSAGVDSLDGLKPPTVRRGCSHAYYVWVLGVDEEELGVSRDLFQKALNAEGFPCFQLSQPLYLLPTFQRRIAIGGDGYPFSLGSPSYAPGTCPVAERLADQVLIGFECCPYDVDGEDLKLLVEAIQKVHRNRARLAEHDRGSP